MIVILVRVEDMIVGANKEKLLCETKQILKDRFRMKNLGKLSYFWGH